MNDIKEILKDIPKLDVKEFNKTLNPTEFDQIFKQTVDMIEDAFAWQPNSSECENFIKSSKYSPAEWSDIITKKPAYYIFEDVDGFYIKTIDKKIEKLGDYITRIEKTLIKVSKLYSDEKSRLELLKLEVDKVNHRLSLIKDMNVFQLLWFKLFSKGILNV